MGAQGVLHRSPSGRWERRPVLDLRPLRSDGSTALYRVAGLTPLGLLVAAPVFWLWGRRQPGRRSGMAATVSAVGAVVILTVAGILGLATVEFTVTGPAVAAIALAVFVAAILTARRPVPPPAPLDEWPPPARTNPPPR
jgi:heme A synthase